MFQLTYSLLLSLAFIIMLPYFAFEAFVKRKYLSNFSERLGNLPGGSAPDDRPVIWIHAVSVGEALAALPLVRAVHERFPQHRIVFSTTTLTGQLVARSRVAEAERFCYFPFDWRFSVRRALDSIKPQVVILMESELWLNFLSECRERKIPVIVANGRISDRSFSRSLKFGFFTSRLYRLVSRFEMQGEADAQRARALGAPAERVFVSGNIKYDIGEAAGAGSSDAKTAGLDELFGLTECRLIIAGSTGDGEEEIVLEAFRRLRSCDGLNKVRLLIAPRHPERFDAVARLLESSHLSFIRRSAYGDSGDDRSRGADVILLDTIGELASLYAAASAVFVGGSLIPRGGHNILEPALFARPVIVGPHMENFRDITNEFLRRGALIQLDGRNDEELTGRLSDELIRILTDDEEAKRLGSNARRAVEENRGATARTVEAVAELIGIPGQS